MKHFLRPTMLAVAATAALGMTAGAYAQSGKSTAPSKPVDKMKASYVVGWDLAGSLPPIVRDEIDPTTVANALKAALSGQKPTMSDAEAKQVREAFVAQLKTKAEAQYRQIATKNKQEGDAFLAKNKSAPGVHVTASGLQYKVITPGSGQRPGPGDTVQVEYTGTFVNGEVFDASAKHPDPKGGKSVPIPLSGVIPGFREGLQLMQTGAHYKFFIPSTLAYGSEPKNGFPPNAAIIFDVTLEKVMPGPPQQNNSNSNGGGGDDDSGN